MKKISTVKYCCSIKAPDNSDAHSGSNITDETALIVF